MEKRYDARKVICLLACLCLTALTACGDKNNKEPGSNTGNVSADTSAEDRSVTTITVKKDGSITNNIVEDFGENYYDVDVLKGRIEESIAQYNTENASSGIKLKKCTASGGVAKVRIEFGNYKEYEEFNGETFFAGTVQEANQAGYDLNVTLNAVSGQAGTESISKPELMGMGSSHIVILSLPKQKEEGLREKSLIIECFDEIQYVSAGVQTVDKKSADVAAVEEYGIIVFK